MSASPLSLDDAQLILRDYGHFLALAEPSIQGLPQSTLPHDKSAIKEAIQTIFQQTEITDPGIRSSLIEAYVFLAHFIPDETFVAIGGGTCDWDKEHLEQLNLEQSYKASQVVNTIKLEMEALLAEAELFTTTTEFKQQD